MLARMITPLERRAAFAIAALSAAFLLGCSDRAPVDDDAAAAVRERPIPAAVRQELVRLGAEDQAIREELSPERMRDTAFAHRMLRGDSVRTARLQEIVDAYGWPDSSRVGGEAAGAAFLILQHSPSHGFQKEMLPVVEELTREGAIPAQRAALLIDRVLMHEDSPHRYGTQFTLLDGQWVLHPVEDEGGLEERRRAIGLPSMEEYMRLMEDVYDAPVVRESGG